VPTADEIDLEDVSTEPCGPTLNAEKLPADTEDQVTAGVFRQRLEYLDTELDCLQSDRHLADGASGSSRTYVRSAVVEGGARNVTDV
jgi:hypothetical protein